jgi:hypothetical protein
LSEFSRRVTSGNCDNLSSTKKSRRVGGIKVYFKYIPLIHCLIVKRRTRQQTGHLTALKSMGMALLYFAVDHLHIEEMAPYKDVEKGKSKAEVVGVALGR